VHIGLQMEDGDSDAEIMMADYGTRTEFSDSDDADPNVTRESGIRVGSPRRRFPGVRGDFPIPVSPGPDSSSRLAGNPSRPGESANGPNVFRFGRDRDRESGSGPGAARRGFPGLALGSAELVPA
jgi:hypothetical protein